MLKGDEREADTLHSPEESADGTPTGSSSGKVTRHGSNSKRSADTGAVDNPAVTGPTSIGIRGSGATVAAAAAARADALHAAAAPPPPQRNTSTSVKKLSFLRSFHLGSLMSAAVAECVGTFLLVLTLPLALKENSEMAPIGVGFLLVSLVLSFGYLSGGHLNPMVTVSVWLSTTSGAVHAVFSRQRLVLYLVAQMAGGTLAGFFVMMIEGRDFPVPNMGDDFVRMLRGFLAESVFTFVLCSVVLHATLSKQRNTNFYGFAIGFALLCGGLTCGPVSGAAFNPAVATPLIVIRCFFSFTKDACLPMGSLWVYWASELVGAVVASILYLALANAEDLR